MRDGDLDVQASEDFTQLPGDLPHLRIITSKLDHHVSQAFYPPLEGCKIDLANGLRWRTCEMRRQNDPDLIARRKASSNGFEAGI